MPREIWTGDDLPVRESTGDDRCHRFTKSLSRQVREPRETGQVGPDPPDPCLKVVLLCLLYRTFTEQANRQEGLADPPRTPVSGSQ